MSLLDLIRKKPKQQNPEQKVEQVNMDVEEVIPKQPPPIKQSTGGLNLSKKIESSFDTLNLNKEDVRKKRRFLLDVSGSMEDEIHNVRKIDSLREVMGKYPDANKTCFSTDVSNCDKIPEPNGGTNLARALRFVKSVNPTPERVILVSDGEPDSKSDAKRAAVELGIPIDIIFIGEEKSDGHWFMEELAELTRGQHFVV